MVSSQHDAQWRERDQLVLQVPWQSLVPMNPAEGQVDVAVLQLTQARGQALGLNDLDEHLGQVCPQLLSEEGTDQSLGDLVKTDRPDSARDLEHEIRRIRKQAATTFDEQFPRRGQLDGAAIAKEQKDTQSVLELTDLRGQRLLSDDEAGCRTTEVELFGQCDGIADQTKVHRVLMLAVGSWVTHHPPSLESLRCAATVMVTEAEAENATPTGQSDW